MDSKKRIIVNTGAQYIKAIINICLALYSTRLILDALDIDDYGIYSAVASVVSILGYLTNALVITTQRYLSFYLGKGQKEYVNKVFVNSLLIHIAICLLFGIILFALKYIMVNMLLNIPPDRLVAAEHVYSVVVLMLILTILTTPFKALLVANENIVYIAVVEVFDGILKLALALTLMVTSSDKLEFYAIGLFLILMINFLAFSLYCLAKYQECHINFRENTLDLACIKQLTGFAGWTTFGTLAGMCQIQGLAIIINRFFGTAMNAAFGIAQQVNGAVRFVSTSVINAMNPQIMKAEGNGNRKRMLVLASQESKFSAALMIIISVPIMVEMETLLSFWLKTVPEYSVLFCRAFMIAFIIDQLTLGLHAANQATGQIKVYTIWTTIPKILIVPIAWGLFRMGLSTFATMCIYVGVEVIVAAFRIPYMKQLAGLNILEYISSVIIPLVPLSIIVFVTCVLFSRLFGFNYGFLLSTSLSAACGIIAFWVFTLNHAEKEFIRTIVKSRFVHENNSK